MFNWFYQKVLIFHLYFEYVPLGTQAPSSQIKIHVYWTIFWAVWKKFFNFSHCPVDFTFNLPESKVMFGMAGLSLSSPSLQPTSSATDEVKSMSNDILWNYFFFAAAAAASTRLPSFYELTRLIYLCSCRNCLTRIYILQIIMQARGHYSKLNFTFLRFPLSQRSISLQNDIGTWTSTQVANADYPISLPYFTVLKSECPVR